MARRWTLAWAAQWLFLLMLGNLFEVLPVRPQQPSVSRLGDDEDASRRTSLLPVGAQDAALPPGVLTAAQLPKLRELLSDKKVTVRLGLRVSLAGPVELLEPQRLLSSFQKPGIYNLGPQGGVFSMQILGIRRLNSAP